MEKVLQRSIGGLAGIGGIYHPLMGHLDGLLADLLDGLLNGVLHGLLPAICFKIRFEGLLTLAVSHSRLNVQFVHRFREGGYDGLLIFLVIRVVVAAGIAKCIVCLIEIEVGQVHSVKGGFVRGHGGVRGGQRRIVGRLLPVLK